MTSPLTIVIPAYNRADTIGRTLHSIDRQTVRPAEVIIVDNASSDMTLAVIETWADGKDYVKVLSEPLRGACHARNRGLLEVSSEWTMFFDSDDVMHPSHVEDFTRAIADNPQADVIGRDIVTRFLDGRVKRLYFMGGKDAMFHHIFRSSLSTQRYVARTCLFRNAGGWDTSLDGWNDYELGVRILLSLPAIVELGGTPTVTTYQQTESITGTSFSAHPGRWEKSLSVIKEHFTSMPEFEPLRHRYIDWIDARAMILAAQYAREGNNDLAVSLRDRVMTASHSPSRLKAIYLHNRLFGRLTWLLTKLFY